MFLFFVFRELCPRNHPRRDQILGVSGKVVFRGALSILQIGSFCHLQPLSPELLLHVFGTPLFEGPRGLQVKVRQTHSHSLQTRTSKGNRIYFFQLIKNKDNK